MLRIAGEAIPGDDKDLAGLQAADLLAGEHSACLRTGQRGAPYMEIVNSHIPLMAFRRSRRVRKSNDSCNMLQRSDGRQELTQAMVKWCKENGVNLNDYK